MSFLSLYRRIDRCEVSPNSRSSANKSKSARTVARTSSYVLEVSPTNRSWTVARTSRFAPDVLEVSPSTRPSRAVPEKALEDSSTVVSSPQGSAHLTYTRRFILSALEDLKDLPRSHRKYRYPHVSLRISIRQVSKLTIAFGLYQICIVMIWEHML